MLAKYILNKKIIKQRIGSVPKKVELYDFVIKNKNLSNFESDDIFIVVSLEKNIFKFNLFASLILEEIENPHFEFKDFLENLSKFFAVELDILKKDCSDFLIDIETQAIVVKSDLKCL